MGVSANSVSRVVGVEVAPKNFDKGAAQMLPQRLAIFGQGNDDAVYNTDKYEVQASAQAVAEKFGYGSPLHLAARQLFPLNGTSATFPVTIYPLKKANASVAAKATITVAGSATATGKGTVKVGGIKADFIVEKDADAAHISRVVMDAINGVLEMPVAATQDNDGNVLLTAKWSGDIGNDIRLSVELADIGATITHPQKLSTGAGRASITDALSKINNVWETFILNTLGYKEKDLLDEYQEFGVARWGVLNKKPCLVATGSIDNYETRTAVTDTRKDDYINFLIQSTNSPELPFVIAAKGLVNDIMTTADSNPAQGYKGVLSGLEAAADEYQEPYTVRDMAVKKGASTNILNGNNAELNDIVTMYHPDEEGKYPYRRYVVDLVKLMNVVYNVRLITEASDKKGAPLLGDKDVTTNKTAIQPKTIKGELAILADDLVLAAILTNSEYTKKYLTVERDSENPKRVNNTFPCKLSGNLEVLSTDIYFGFEVGA